MPATDDESATRPRPAAQSPVHPNELIDPTEHGAKNPARVDITETHVRSSGSSAAFLVAALLLAAMAGSIVLIVTGAIAVKAAWAYRFRPYRDELFYFHQFVLSFLIFCCF